jgi:hypothetical protein
MKRQGNPLPTDSKTPRKMSDKYLIKRVEYVDKINAALLSLFDEDSDNFIGHEELNEGDNLTHFMHALANMVPANFYNGITGKNVNILEFNHIANQLCFQYSKKSD